MSVKNTKISADDESTNPTTQPLLEVIIERLNNLYHQNEASQLLLEELRSDVKARFEVLETQLNEIREGLKK
jgi:hypothetical protein